MAVYTVKAIVRPRATKTTIRKRLRGNALAGAHSALRHLRAALGHDQRLKARSPDVAATRLIFLGDAANEAAVQDIIDTLAEAIGSKTTQKRTT